MKGTIISIAIAVALIVGALFLANKNDVTDNLSLNTNANNVSIVDGKQIIEITARGGYQPRKSTAKEGIPT
ncbi:MAG: hypothetical protein WCK03_02640, partial [Candidatus Taylorbacteria bacterium]